ncbi:replicative DNA helicase [Candidatus Deferrimicrobium sp.]|uniref:replicative DNA helicase n=1 Tax=Candidatus Deferrimicrobium sp. TaxID=3060586 RepID=UPI003C312D76
MDDYRGTTPGGNDASLRVPPHDLHAEQAVLASVLLNNDLINGVMEVLRPGDFYQGAHRILYEAMVDLYDRGRPIDQLTLSAALKDRNAEQQVGGLAYLSEIVTSVPISANVVHYAHIVKEKSILRKTISAAQEIAASAFQGVADIDLFLDRTEQTIFAIAEEKIRPSYYAMGEMAREAMKEIEEAYERKERITGVASGFRDLDQVTAGFQRSNMIVVAARPGMGKTSLVLNVAVNAATRQKLPVAIFSLEMSRQELAMRMICSEARVNFQRLRTGHLVQEEVNRLVAAVGKLSEAPIYTDDSGTLSAMELRARARRLKKERGIGMIIVDYLQLMHGSNTRQNSENRVQEVSEISRSMKSLAKELNIPVVAVSQLSRGVESRTDKRPQMADLRECVTGDTLVLTTDGGRVPIRELVGRQVDVWAMSPEGRIVPAKSDCVWSVGEKPVMCVVLASGRTIRATSEHLLYGPGVWTRVGELKPGDRLAIARAVPGPEQAVVWPEEHIALLGHLVGDGSYLVNQPMRYTTASEENSRAVTDAAQGAFGVTVKRYAGRGNWHQLLLTGNGNRWHPAGVNRWLRDLGIFGQRSHDKRLPADVFRFDNVHVGLLLRHLWATDGSISCRSAGSKGSARVYFSTASEGLARDVAALLLRLGIVARIRSVQKTGYRPVFTVDVSGAEQQARFLDAVGAFGPRVAPAQRLRAELETVIPNTNIDTLPVEVFARVKLAMQERGISQRTMAAMRGTSFGGNAHFAFAPSREVVAGYAAILEDDALRLWAENDLFWDRVVEVSPGGSEEVFDLTVPGLSSWLADGIVSHNSGAIEQDSDLILFVYREEMYAKEKTPQEAKGVAEIIIGKNRSGPMRDVKLAFLSQFTRFEDLAQDLE